MNTLTRKISDLRPHPKQQAIYGDLSHAEFRELVDDIQRNGLRQPPEIAPDGTILDGHQRVLAYTQLGKKEIEVFVRDVLTEDELEDRFIQANLVRRHLDPLAKARAIQALAELEQRRPGVPGVEFRERLAQRLGGNMSGRSIDRYLKLLTLPRPIQDAVSRNELTMMKALKVASLPQKKQNAIAADISQGESPNALVEKYLPRPAPKASNGAASPADLYYVLVDFFATDLDTVEKSEAEIVGQAKPHQATAALLDRAANFCLRMRDLELDAHRKMIMQMRAKIELH